MPKQELSILILTHNEEKNISKCIESILPLTDKIHIVDSGSSDATVKIAQQFGARVEQHPWTTYANQFNWGLDNFKFETEWIMRMDADEEFTPDLVKALDSFLKSPPDKISGVYIKRRVYFMGKWIKHGGYYPTWLLRVFRNDIGKISPEGQKRREAASYELQVTSYELRNKRSQNPEWHNVGRVVSSEF